MKKISKKKTLLIILSIIFVIIIIIILDPFTTPTDYSNMEGLEFPKTFEEYIYPYGEINDIDLYNEYKEKYKILYKEINDDKNDEDTQSKFIEDFNTPLREMGIPLPFISFNEFFNSIDSLTQQDRDELSILFNKYSEETEDYKIYEKPISDILIKYDLNGKEVLDQLGSYNYKYAIFSINNGEIKLDNNYKANIKSISKEKEAFYRGVIEKVFEIAPPSIRDRINTVEFSTDGLDRSLAYVLQNSNYTKFRLSIDEKDALDEDGNFTREGLETLIHEFAHIITLNETQVVIEEIDKDDADFSKSYKPSSYTYSFYEHFWKDIYSDYKELNNMVFYKIYKTQFVSDYAATNIDEDIAESFRIYVFDIETKENTIQSEKVQFFKNYEELVNMKKYFQKFIVY